MVLLEGQKTANRKGIRYPVPTEDVFREYFALPNEAGEKRGEEGRR